MPSLTTSELSSMIKLDGTNSYPTFVETGTYMGETVTSMVPFFTCLHSIEIDEKLVKRAKSLYGSLPITFHQGDSTHVFKELLPTISTNTVFWLDGHWSAGYDAGRGKKDCPLLDELQLIIDTFEHNAIVLIDDCRLFGTRIVEDWTDITAAAVDRIVKPRLIKGAWFPSSLHPTDRLALVLKSKDDTTN